MIVDDELLGVFVMVCFVVFGWDILWGDWMWVILVGFCFIIVVWMVNWVYGSIMNGWVDIVLVFGVSFV